MKIKCLHKLLTEVDGTHYAFDSGKEYDVPDKVGIYLVTTFPDWFTRVDLEDLKPKKKEQKKSIKKK